MSQESVNKLEDITVLDIFHQGAHCGIPAQWCVQYMKVGATFVEYEYFKTWTEANEFAMKYGYND